MIFYKLVLGFQSKINYSIRRICMPIINIKTLKLDQSVKNIFADKIYEISYNSIGIPAIEIYFNEYDSYHINGKLITSENPVVTVEVQGPPIGKEKTAELAVAVKAATINILGESKTSIFAYHYLGEDTFAINGTLLSDMEKPK